MAEKGKVRTWKPHELNPLCTSFEKWPGAVTLALGSKFSLGHLLSWAVWGESDNISLPGQHSLVACNGTQLWLPWAGEGHRMGRKAPASGLRKGWGMNSSEWCSGLFITGLRIPLCRVRAAGEAWVPHHPLGRKAGCFDCWFHHYSIQWWGERSLMQNQGRNITFPAEVSCEDLR